MLVPLRPRETYQKYMDVAKFISRFIGVDVIIPEYRMNWITYVVIISITFSLLFSANTARMFMRNDWTILLEVLCTSCTGVIGASKLISFTRNARRFYELHLSLNEIYKKYQSMGPHYEAVLMTSCRRVRTILRLMGLIYAQVSSLVICVPLFILVFGGKRYMILQFYIPGLDINTDLGYWTTFLFHSICSLMAGFGLYAGDTFLLIFLTHTMLYVDILKLKIVDLNKVIKQDEAKSNITELLHDIVGWHQAYFEYTQSVNVGSYWSISVQIGCSAFSILFTLFIISTKDWPAAYAFLIYNFSALYEYCILGTKVEVCNDQICSEIYKINWYELNTAQQKIVFLMLIRAQSPSTIDVAGIMPLSVSTGLTITRTLYSTFMMMMQLN